MFLRPWSLRLVLIALPFQLSAASDTIVALPFFNNTRTANLDWVGESVAETLRESLAASGALVLTREDRAEVYRRLAVRSSAILTHATVFRIGESLDASQVIFGSFELIPASSGASSRGTLKINAQILDVKRTRGGPHFEQTGPLEELSLLETRLAWQCRKALMPHATPCEEEYLRSHPPIRIDAMESYIRGLLASAPEQRQRLFLQSIHLDERFSEPAFQLGMMAVERKDYRAALTWLQKVGRSDSHAHEAQFLSGLCHYYLGEYEQAIQTFRIVATDVPLNEVFNDLGAAESRRNDPEALDNFRKALDGDESDPDYWFNVGYVQWKLGRNGEAQKSFQAVLDRTPDDDEAKKLLSRARRGEGPRTGESLTAERIKQTFEETAFLQLKAELKK